MINYIIRKILFLIPVIFGVITLVFFFIHIIPGDPLDIMLGESAIQADKELLKKELRLDRPIYEQYIYYLKNIFKGDIGISIHSREKVMNMILSRFPATIELAISSMIIAMLISIPAGVISALRHNSIFDNISIIFSLIGISMPSFWLGPILIIIFSIKLNVLPVSGRGGLSHLILPSITLGTAMAAILSRMIRASLLDVLNEDYLLTARAKGLKESVIIIKHALMNAIIPAITILSLQFGALLSGSIIVETIFSWPGFGRLTIQAIDTRDYPLVQGCILVISLSYVVINFITDIIYAYVDPRISYK
jgi:peptide/nickel transport system permease protein